MRVILACTAAECMICATPLDCIEKWHPPSPKVMSDRNYYLPHFHSTFLSGSSTAEHLWSHFEFSLFFSDQVLFLWESLDSGSPYGLLKRKWMGTQRTQMKGVLPWLVHWSCHAGTRDFWPALAACSSRPSTKYFFPARTLFQCICPHRLSSKALGRQSCWVSCLLICFSVFYP